MTSVEYYHDLGLIVPCLRLKTAMTWFNSARLRASWGQAGNLTGISSYGRFTNYSASNINGLATYNLDPSLGNEIVQPERASETEFGSDLSFFESININLPSSIP